MTLLKVAVFRRSFFLHRLFNSKKVGLMLGRFEGEFYGIPLLFAALPFRWMWELAARTLGRWCRCW